MTALVRIEEQRLSRRELEAKADREVRNPGALSRTWAVDRTVERVADASAGQTLQTKADR